MLPSPFYLSDYRAHLDDTRDHLAGIAREHSDESNDDDDSSDFDESGVTFWSSEEKARLFHALAVHSRWRPDLIAVCVQTKSILDVSLYLESLREAADALEAGTWRPESDGESEGERDADIEADHDEQENTSESDQPPTESSAGTLEMLSSDADRRARPYAMAMSNQWVRLEESQAKLLARVEPRWEAAALRKSRRAEDNIADGRIFRQERWAREDMLSRLGPTDLRVMAALIREYEDAQDEQPSNKRKRETDDEDEIATAEEEDANTDVDTPDLSAMSPMARRRYQKRLYMRRKRAALSGAPVVHNVARLKPGRRFCPRIRVKQRIGRPKKKRRCKVDGENEDESEAPEKYPNVGGVTTPYRIKGEFLRVGVEGDALHRDGYGLLNLGNIARAMKTTSTGSLLINATTIRLLDAATTGYLRELIGRVVVLRAEEVKQKGDDKVWHNSTSEIRARDVRKVIEEWDVERYPFAEALPGDEESELEDVDSEAEQLELEEEEILDQEDCAAEERFERQLRQNVIYEAKLAMSNNT